jgi:membrane protein required for beta-lactamase induction
MIPNQDGSWLLAWSKKMKIFKKLIQFYYFMKTSLARVGIISGFLILSFALLSVCAGCAVTISSALVQSVCRGARRP